MSFFTAALIVGGSTLAAGAISAYGSNQAAKTQAGADNAATASQNARFGQITANSQPFMNAGYGATNTLSQLMGTSGTPGSTVAGTGGLQNGYLTSTFNPTQADLNNYPGYQFALQQGGQATRNADTPGVGALSGAALKDLTNFNVGTASQYYNQDFNQFQTQQNNIYNRLSGIAGLGQSAAAGVGNSGTQLGQSAAQSTAASGATSAAGTVGVSNALAGTASSLGGLGYLYSQNGAAPAVGVGSDPNGYLGTANNPSAFVSGGG